MKSPILSRNVSFTQTIFASDGLLLRKTRSSKVKLEKVYGMCRRKRRGVAAVEFAIVAPIFLLLVLGMIEVGRMIMVQQLLTNASREGARIAILDGTTHKDVVDKVDAYLTSAKIHGATVTVDPNEPSSAGYGQPVTVTVTVPATSVSWIPRPKFAVGKDLRASSVMRRETVQ